MIRWGPGPVFAADCLTTARRWQVYAGRALLVACLLAGLILVWLNRFAGRQFTTHQQLAEVGSAFFGAIMAVELVLALLVVPAATAGAICHDKMRGGLALMLATDLSDAEVVLGRFAARLATVLGVVACGLPVLAIAASLGGVDPGESLGGSMVVVGVATLGVGVALTYSVWATLDLDPVLWRERRRRRSSGWGRAIWRLYGVLSAAFTLLAILVNRDIAPGVAAFMVSIGLLMASVTSATALSEERSRGSLDVLMAAPLSTRAIVLGKWRGVFRMVPGLAILPGVLAFGTASVDGRGTVAVPFAALIIALVLGYGAVVTSVGLALASWQPRLGRAVAFSVAAYLVVAVIYPAIVIVTWNVGPGDVVFLWMSPFFGMFIPMGWATWRHPSFVEENFVAMSAWVAPTWALALVVLWATLTSFDRLLGRIPERPGRISRIPATRL